MHSWLNETMNWWINHSVIQWIQLWIIESMKQGTTESMNQRIDVSVNQWVTELMIRWNTDSMNPCMHDLVSRGISESMSHWFSASMNQWINQPVNQRISESMNQWTNEWWQNEGMDGWMNGWMDGWANYFSSLSCFFTERPLRWGTSSLSYSFSEQPLIRATSASQLALLQLLQPNSSLRAAVWIHALPNCYSPLLLPDTNCSCLLLTQWQDCPWTFIRNSEVFELIKLPSVKSHWSICGSHGSKLATNTPTLQPSCFVGPFRFDSTCQCALQRVRSCISWYLRFVHHRTYQVLLNLHCSPWCWPIFWLVAKKRAGLDIRKW